jgi:uncharacterized protein YkwD
MAGAVPVPALAHGRVKRARAGCVKQGTQATGGTGVLAHVCRPSQRKLKSSKQKTAKSRVATPRRTRPTTEPAPTPAQPAEATVTATQQLAAHDASTIAAELAAPCQNTELTPEPADLGLVRTAVLCLINRKRAENSEAPLIASADLEQAAEGHCEELIADDYFAHVSPSGETPVDRIRDTGYIPNSNVGYVIGENLAWGTYQLSTPQAIVSAWFASPGHLANILEPQYRETGIAVTPAVPASLAAGAPGATYAQEFGVVIQ